mmetsp:Transcript_117048/g.335812  ORF Transcript_117048/g.335812 Transcript_117048/m.335812 type:complete len:278 (+) Transcript_117048:463-1296(+)
MPSHGRHASSAPTETSSSWIGGLKLAADWTRSATSPSWLMDEISSNRRLPALPLLAPSSREHVASSAANAAKQPVVSISQCARKASLANTCSDMVPPRSTRMVARKVSERPRRLPCIGCSGLDKWWSCNEWPNTTPKLTDIRPSSKACRRRTNFGNMSASKLALCQSPWPSKRYLSNLQTVSCSCTSRSSVHGDLGPRAGALRLAGVPLVTGSTAPAALASAYSLWSPAGSFLSASLPPLGFHSASSSRAPSTDGCCVNKPISLAEGTLGVRLCCAT